MSPPLLLLVWLAAALTFVGAGGLRALPAPFPQAVLATLLLGLLLAYGLQPGFRAWLRALPTGTFLALHLLRFVGIYFLVLHGRGELPWAFAVPGGWGDIAVATGALALLLGPAPARRIGSGWLQAWNLLGLLDILFVVATAARLALADPGSMRAILQLPLGLLPTFVVPLIVFSHVVLAVEGLRARRGGAP